MPLDPNPIALAPSGAVRRWSVVVERPDGTAFEHALEQDACSIGRDPACPICLPDREISKRHARLERREDGAWWLVDQDSRSGTFFNGVRVSEPVRVGAGDVIHIGDYRLEPRSSGPGPKRQLWLSQAGSARLPPPRVRVYQGRTTWRDMRLDRGLVTLGTSEDVDVQLDPRRFSGIRVVIRPCKDGSFEVIDESAEPSLTVNGRELGRVHLGVHSDDIVLGLGPLERQRRDGDDAFLVRYMAGERKRGQHTPPHGEGVVAAVQAGGPSVTADAAAAAVLQGLAARAAAAQAAARAACSIADGSAPSTEPTPSEQAPATDPSSPRSMPADPDVGAPGSLADDTIRMRLEPPGASSPTSSPAASATMRIAISPAEVPAARDTIVDSVAQAHDVPAASSARAPQARGTQDTGDADSTFQSSHQSPLDATHEPTPGQTPFVPSTVPAPPPSSLPPSSGGSQGPATEPAPPPTSSTVPPSPTSNRSKAVGPNEEADGREATAPWQPWKLPFFGALVVACLALGAWLWVRPKAPDVEAPQRAATSVTATEPGPSIPPRAPSLAETGAPSVAPTPSSQRPSVGTATAQTSTPRPPKAVPMPTPGRKPPGEDSPREPSGDDRQDALRRRLEAKLAAGKASPGELETLFMICQQQRDAACASRADAAIRKNHE